MSTNRKIAVIGLGYVGLPVATTFARYGAHVLGFDVSQKRIDELKKGIDVTDEVEPEDLASPNLRFSTDPDSLKEADFFIVTVPTPIDSVNQPDLTALLKASETVGKALKKGDIVVYESTVYPGATEEDCIPVLEKASGLKAGADFKVGYSPERINPGDKEHRFDSILKIVSGQDAEALRIISETYGSVVKAGIHEAPTIKTAEAAKVIENTQRDINIALMNEFALIFGKLGIDTNDVLDAAGTKWNFLRFSPGLVGGHCIGVDPYYLTHRAQRAKYHPEVILSGRRINDSMGKLIADNVIRALLSKGVNTETRIKILGFTFKENVPDVRNTKVIDIVQALQSLNMKVEVCDPRADIEDAKHEYGVYIHRDTGKEPADAIILAVGHEEFVKGGWSFIAQNLKDGKGVVYDVKSVLPRDEKPDGIELIRL